MIEVCIDSFKSARNAVEGGADRLEVCHNLVIGGTTPSIGLLRLIKEHYDIPCHILIRPRYGDFVYSEEEILEMIEDIKLFKAHGADGFVIGALDKEGYLDKRALKRLIEVAKPTYITFHRAFDQVQSPELCLEELINLGVDCILTSGQMSNAYEGKELIKELVRLANGRISIMPGAGITTDNFMEIKQETTADFIHFSAKKVEEKKSPNLKVDVGLQGKKHQPIYITDTEIVKIIKELDEKIVK
ncbi:copper homeostasis protein CutC [Vallitalea okinawensis]|uniref:copper homeostasis protein CutC n=1 Tax=Vallitalea okinawensis TaxID=2078660 RepID=UPI000CFA9E0D|nr:copper homeostasis protein CutC [Vallitalea okinawensis]